MFSVILLHTACEIFGLCVSYRACSSETPPSLFLPPLPVACIGVCWTRRSYFNAARLLVFANPLLRSTHLFSMVLALPSFLPSTAVVLSASSQGTRIRSFLPVFVRGGSAVFLRGSTDCGVRYDGKYRSTLRRRGRCVFRSVT